MKNYRKFKITLGLVIASAYLLAAFQNCSQTKFSKGAEDLASNAAGLPSSIPTVNKSYSFSVSSQTNNKMDILFVVDNSGSMAAEQLKLAEVFQNFIQSLAGLDYRVAITTTDNSSAETVFGSKGKLLPMRFKLPAATTTSTSTTSGGRTSAASASTGLNDTSPITAADIFYVDNSTVNGQDLFIHTIQTGISGSGTETGMTSIKNFVTKSLVAGSPEKSFIRPGAMFSTIVVTDSDQAQTASQAMATSTLLSHISTNYSIDKKYVHHSSIALPGDSACLAQSEVYGTSYYNLSVATGGINASLCSPDYAAQFQLIAEVLINRVSEQTLECAPVDGNGDGSLDISIHDSAGVEVTGFTVVGNIVRFASALSNVDTYSVQYKCAAQ